MKKETNCGIIKVPRTGCKDIFNAYMCRGAIFGHNDIPQCPTTATKLPEAVITWEEAKSIYIRIIFGQGQAENILSQVALPLMVS